MNWVCDILPIACTAAKSTDPKGGGFLSAIGGFFDLFSGNAASDALKEALKSVKDTPNADLGLKAFLDLYRAVYALVIAIAVIIFFVNVIRIAVSRSRGEQAAQTLVGTFKVFFVGAYLPAVIGLGIILSEDCTKIISALLDFLPNNHWDTNITTGFSVDNFFVHLGGSSETFFLQWEVASFQLAIYLFVPLGLIAYGLTAGNPDHVMGRASRWIWAGLTTALVLKPILMLILGLGGYTIGIISTSQFNKGLMVLALLGLSLFVWFFTFKSNNQKIKAAVQNRVLVRGDVNSRQNNTPMQQRIDIRTTQRNQLALINSRSGKQGLRFARHKAVDMAVPVIATKVATAIHPVAGAAVHVGHAFFKGRRPHPRP